MSKIKTCGEIVGVGALLWLGVLLCNGVLNLGLQFVIYLSTR